MLSCTGLKLSAASLVLKLLEEVKIIECYVDESCIYVRHIWRTSRDKSSTSLNTRRLLVEGKGGRGTQVGGYV